MRFLETPQCLDDNDVTLLQLGERLTVTDKRVLAWDNVNRLGTQNLFTAKINIKFTATSLDFWAISYILSCFSVPQY